MSVWAVRKMGRKKELKSCRVGETVHRRSTQFLEMISRKICKEMAEKIRNMPKTYPIIVYITKRRMTE